MSEQTETENYDASDLAEVNAEDLAVLFQSDAATVITMPNGARVTFRVRRLTLGEIVQAASLLRAFSEAFNLNPDVGTAVASVIQSENESMIELLAQACGTEARVIRFLPGAAFVDLTVAFIEENRDFFDRVRQGREALTGPEDSTTDTKPSLSDGAESSSALSQTATG